jgi:UDP-glucose 4-epimerase
MSEDFIPQPEDSYGIAKYSIEQELKITNRLFGLDYIVFRPHNIYGERQNLGDPYRNVIGIFMNQIMENKPLSIFGDGNQSRAFTYVRDVAPIIALAPLNNQAFGKVFNIGADTPYTINDLVKLVAEAMDVDVELIHHDARKEVLHAYASHKLAKEFFNYPPETPLNIGLKKMAEWAKKNGSRQGKPFENIEISKNMPKHWQNILKR